MRGESRKDKNNEVNDNTSNIGIKFSYHLGNYPKKWMSLSFFLGDIINIVVSTLSCAIYMLLLYINLFFIYKFYK